MKKIIIIGCPGAGKSVFSQKLKEIINFPLYHLDMLYHKTDGTHISKEELEEKLREIFKNNTWIIDGNYQRTLEMRIKECDTVFLLDYPTEVCVTGAESRIGQKREDLPWVEKNLDEIPLLPTKIEGTLCVCPTELYEGFFVAKIKKWVYNYYMTI